MTDDFEELIRTAGRGLGTAGETPTYHGSWKRGQRRRFVKRAAMTAAGACALVVAFTADVAQLDQFGEDRSTEVADIPTNAIEITPTWVVPTTDPLEPIPSVAADVTTAPTLDLPPAPAAAPDDARGTRDPGDETTSQQATTSIVTPEPFTGSASIAESVTPTAAPVPSAAPTTPVAPATPTAVATAIPTAAPFTNDPVASGDKRASDGGVAGDQQPAAGTQSSPAPTMAATSTPVPAPTNTPVPSPTSTAVTSIAPPPPPATPTATPTPTPDETGMPGLPVDAVVLGPVIAAEGPYACDTDFDGIEDAECELLVSYPCSFEREAAPGFVATDADGDGVIDTCVPAGDTWCRVSSGGERTRQACVIFGSRP